MIDAENCEMDGSWRIKSTIPACLRRSGPKRYTIGSRSTHNDDSSTMAPASNALGSVGADRGVQLTPERAQHRDIACDCSYTAGDRLSKRRARFARLPVGTVRPRSFPDNSLQPRQ